MTTERINPSEQEPIISSFQKSLEKLSDIKDSQPLSPDEIIPSEIRKELEEAGLNISVIENNPILQESIKHPQFRDNDQGKRPAVVAVLDAVDYKKYVEWANKESINQPMIGKPKSDDDRKKREESKRRGLMQFLGETIAVASNQLSPEDFCCKTNWRVVRSLQRHEKSTKGFDIPKITDENYDDFKIIASIPEGSAIKAYEFILSLNK